MFPAVEAVRGRPTVPLLRYLEKTQYGSTDALAELQVALLHRVLRHAYLHTHYYRQLLDDRGLHFEDVRSIADLALLPLLDRDTVRLTLDARTSSVPPLPVNTETTSGTTGEPVVVRSSAESRHWRDATRWRGYGWAGYHVGDRAFHYATAGRRSESWFRRGKIALGRVLNREHHVDCTARDDAALMAAVDELRHVEPHVIVANAAGAAALARFVNERGLRDWKDIPVITGGARLRYEDRAQIMRAFGPAFETYASHETTMIASECYLHDGMHVAMETFVVEIVVREAGRVRAARPGEIGEIAITDLHNLACPMIRYLTGDLAVARAPAPCGCGRTLARIGSIEGRVAETLHDRHGRPIGGLVFDVLARVLEDVARRFEVVQKLDGAVVVKVSGGALPDRAVDAIHGFASRYLPATPFTIEYVTDLPRRARNVVTVEKSRAS